MKAVFIVLPILIGVLGGSCVTSLMIMNSRLYSINYQLMETNLELREIKERMK